jgi:hypothetical protein
VLHWQSKGLKVKLGGGEKLFPLPFDPERIPEVKSYMREVNP